MNVNSLGSPCFGCKEYAVKVVRATLKDGSTALVKVAINKNYDIRSMSCYQLKKGKLTGGYGIAKARHLTDDDISVVVEKIQEHAKDGKKFFKEFIEAIFF